MSLRSIFSDGGCILHNPSRIGGTWAFVLVDNDEIVKSDKGTMLANPDFPITNNQTEYVAAALGLEALPDNWSGELCSDSQVTLGRLFWGWQLKGLSTEWTSRAICALKRLGKITPVLLQGHPTKAELVRGTGSRGLPVSKWNKWADTCCQNLASDFIAQLREVEVTHQQRNPPLGTPEDWARRQYRG